MLDFLYFPDNPAFPDKLLGEGPAVILSLANNVPPNSCLYFDRYFNTISLLDRLKEMQLHDTGTIMLNRVHNHKKLDRKKYSSMKRGDILQFTSEDEASVKCKDNRASNYTGGDQTSTISRLKMEGKVEVNRLEKEELSYELDIRGITGLTTVDSMRKSLRNLLKLEKAGTSLTFPSYPFTFDEDSVYIERKISEIEILVTDFSDSETSSSFSKIYSKLLHVFERTERSVSTKDEEHSKRSTFLIKLLDLKLNLLSKTRKFKRDSRNSQIPLQLSMIGQAGHSSSRASSLSLVEVHTVAELLQLCRQIEARKISIDSYSPPPKNRANLMEPDLAYVYSSCSSIAGSSREGHEVHGSRNNSSNRRCWNCGSDSHLSIACKEPQRDIVIHVVILTRQNVLALNVMDKDRETTWRDVSNEGWKLLKDIGLSTLDRTSVSSVTVANGDKCECLGVLHVPVRLKDSEKIIDILVVPDLSHTLILGVDFWVRMGIVPDLRSKEWKFTQVNGTFADIDVEALHSRELLTSDQVEILDKLANDCFVRMGNSLGCTKIVEHKIELLDNIRRSVKYVKELQFLGYVVDENGLHVDPGKVEVILQIPTPSKISEVRSLIGTASWYRRFIPNFSTVIQPLTKLLKKNTKFVWTPRQEAALREVKEHLISAPVMACRNFDLPFIVQTDASGYGIGAVLTQNHPDVGERVVSYLSRSLTKQERKFSTTERECLAVIWSIEKLRPYIEGTHFTVVTDHWSLCWLNNLKDPTGRLGRWSLKLQQYSFDLVHRKGKENVVPDMLSRTVPIIDALDIAVNVDLGKSDKWYDRMLYDVDSNPLRFPTWRISDSKLYKYVQFKKIPGLDFHDDWKLVIPKNKRKDILLKCHDDPQAGHPGVFKTFKRVSEHFYWPKMKADISSHVKRCKVCCENKPEQRKPAGLLTPHRVVDRPFQLVCCDLIGPLPRSNRGFKFILVIVDNFSKFSLVIPLRNSTAKLVCTAVEDHLFLMFGPPKFLLSDNGSQFRSKEFKNLLANYAVKQIFTANYHAQVNKTLETMIRCYVSENHKEWDKMLSKVACAIRTQVHESMRRTPYFVVFGREFPMNLEIGVPDSSGDFTVDQEILARDRSVPLQQLYKEVKGKLLKAAERNKRYYDLRHRDVKYEVGDEVYRKNFVHSDAAKFYSSKLANKFVGPFIVFKKVSPWVYELKDPDGRFRGSWHAKDLKPGPK
ncbi:hypothetical protein JTB14_017174 [Gonioctena quinquepunctata]|nr:hypothetical protein JTB14_017174 [Gonioctena quinquepunctata]